MGGTGVERVRKQLRAADVRPMGCGLLNTVVQYQTHPRAEVVHNFVYGSQFTRSLCDDLDNIWHVI